MQFTLDAQSGKQQSWGHFEVIQYPAGEKQVRLTAKGLAEVQKASEVSILHRGVPDVMELFLLVSAVTRVAEFTPVRLILPYLPYSRADRRFVPGDCAGLATFANMFNGSCLDEIVTLDAHSEKAERFLPRLRNVSPERYIREAIQSIQAQGDEYLTVLYPDKGASDRYGDSYGFKHVRVAYADKLRDAKTGKLSGFRVPITDKQVLIVDDICDGGGTFLGIAEKLPAGTEKFLYVTHGIFSKGFLDLTAAFKRIYTTDSLPQFPPAQVTVFPAVKDLL